MVVIFHLGGHPPFLPQHKQHHSHDCEEHEEHQKEVDPQLGTELRPEDVCGHLRLFEHHVGRAVLEDVAEVVKLLSTVFGRRSCFIINLRNFGFS